MRLATTSPTVIVSRPEVRIYNPLEAEGFEEAALGRSESWWMDSKVFLMWLKNVFIPAKNEKFPEDKKVVLLVDGHSSHVTLEASDTCKNNGIIFYCLYLIPYIMSNIDVSLCHVDL